MSCGALLRFLANKGRRNHSIGTATVWNFHVDLYYYVKKVQDQVSIQAEKVGKREAGKKSIAVNPPGIFRIILCLNMQHGLS